MHVGGHQINTEGCPSSSCDHMILKFHSGVKIVLLQVWFQICVALADHIRLQSFHCVGITQAHVPQTISELKTWLLAVFFVL